MAKRGKYGKRLPGGGGPALTRKQNAAPGLRYGERPTPPRKQKKARRRRGGRGDHASRFWRFLVWLCSARTLGRVFSVALTLGILGLFLLIYFTQSLPSISGLNAARKAPGIQVLAADGGIIGSYGQIYGEYLHYDAMPKPLVDAVLATEDRRFFHHFGVDPLGILRAMLVNFRAGKFVQGGSTVTQQVAKNIFLTPDRTMKRKLQEVMLAFWLEGRYSKEEILSIYLNRVYMGSGNFGVDAAAHHYFGKSARQLTQGEAAMIAGLLKAPSRYSPASNPELARKRARQVLLNMVDAGMLTAEDVGRETARLRFGDRLNEGRNSGRFFADWVVDHLPDYLGDVEEDILIHTTLERDMQSHAEEAVEAQMTEEAMEKGKAWQVSLLAMRPDGAITAMIGGREYAKSQFNRAVQAKRQPGSAFKMFIYLAAMEAGYDPEYQIEDKPFSVTLPNQVWQPKNYDGKYRGVLPLREALAQSVNTVAAQLIQKVTPKRVVTLARRLGVRSRLVPLPSLALGSSEVTLLEMTGAYAHLASGGSGVMPYGVREILSRKTGKPLYRHAPPAAYLVVQPDAVARMNSMLTGVISHGTGKAAAIGRPAAGKTGTASDYKDAWFLGYTPDLVAGVWVGNDDASPMAKITGGAIPARVWKEFMHAALEGTPPRALPTEYIVPEPVFPWIEEEPANGGIFSPAAPGSDAFQPPPSGSARRLSLPPLPPPSPDEEKAQPQKPKPAAAQKQDGSPLGRAFWNKLFDSGEVEYEYPQRR
jgi:penicillin-binding protein 1A